MSFRHRLPVSGSSGTREASRSVAIVFTTLLMVLSTFAALSSLPSASVAGTPDEAGHPATGPSDAPASSVPSSDSPVQALPASTGFGTPLAVSTTTSGDENGAPCSGTTDAPAIATDSSGNTYIAWAANISGVWRIYFAEKSSTATSFTVSGPIDSTTLLKAGDVDPTIALHGAGASASIVVGYERLDGYTSALGCGQFAAGNGYGFVYSSNGGTSWSTGGLNSDDGAGYTGVSAPEVAYDDAGNILVAFFGHYPSNHDTEIAVDLYSSTATYKSYGYEEISTDTVSYDPGTLAFECSATVANCAVEYAVNDSSDQYVRLYYSTTDFKSNAFSGPLTLNTLPFDTSCTSENYTLEAPQPGGLIYGSGGNASLIYRYATTGATCSPSYTLGLSYTTNGWTSATAGNDPAGASSTGLRSPSIALNASGALYAAWENASGDISASFAPSSGATFSSVETVTSARVDGVSLSASPALSPFRLDVGYVNLTGQSTPNIYYTNFTGLSASPSVSSTAGDVGQSFRFTSGVAGGVPTYSYLWSFGGLCASSCPTAQPNPTVNASSAGSFAVDLTVKDAWGEIVNASLGTLTVHPAPYVSLLPTTATIDATQWQNWSIAPAGGTSPYTAIQVYLNGVQTQSSLRTWYNTTFAKAGTFYVNASVTDSAGVTGALNRSVLAVNPLPSVSSFATSPSTISLGASTTFKTALTGGTPSFSYVYSGLPAGCTTVNSPWLNCTPTVSGTFTVMVVATDRLHESAYDNASLTVGSSSSGPTISSFTITPSTITVDSATVLTVVASGGTAPLSYVYSGLPAPCTSSNASSLTCTPTATGTFSITVKVTDAKGLSTSSTQNLIVNPKSTSSISIASFAASPSILVIGNSTQFQATASGGVGPLTYTYSSLPTGCSSMNESNLPCTPTATGSYTVLLTVTDAHSDSATATATLDVKPAGSTVALAISTLTALPNPARIGGTVWFNVTATGGTSPYRYSYSGLPGGCSTLNIDSLTCHPTAKGNYTVAAEVIDAQSTSVEENVSIEVLAALVPLSVDLSDNISTLTEPGSVLLLASGSGGVGPYLYVLSLNGTNITAPVSSSSWVESYYHPGTYTYVVWIEDSRHVRAASDSVSVSVSSPTSPAGAPTSFPAWILLLVIAALVGILLLAWADRSRRKRTLGEAGPSGGGPVTPEPGATPSMGVAPTVTAGEVLASASVGTLAAGPSAGAAPDTGPLTNCPQCGSVLGEDHACVQCGVKWEAEAGSAPPVAETVETSPGTAPVAPTTGTLSPPETTSPPVPASTEAKSEEPDKPELKHCVVCGRELVAGYCKSCDMNWADV